MKKKLVALALILALAVSALSLVACGTDFANIYSNPYENKAYSAYLNDKLKVLDSKKDLSLDANAKTISDNCNLSVFETKNANDNKVYMVYNYETETVVLTLTESETVAYDHINVSATSFDDKMYDFISVEKTTTPAEGEPTTEYIMYYADGTVALSYGEDAHVNIIWADRTLFIDGDYYRINKKGKFVKEGTLAKNVAENLPQFMSFVDDRYYNISEGVLSVYDYSFNLVGYYELPSYVDVDDATISVLNDGNVLIQYKFAVSFFESDYTYYNGQNNIKVVTLIYNVKKGETKEIETEALFNYLVARDDKGLGGELQALYDDSIKNLAGVNFITNKQIDQNGKTVSVKNDGSIDEVLDDVIVAFSEIDPHSSGKFIVYTKLGNRYLVDKKGKIVADITDATYNEKYIFVNNKIYDFDFEELATIDNAKWEHAYTMNNSLVFACIDENDADAEKKFGLFADGQFKVVTLADGESLADYTSRYYVISKTVDNTTTYTYYNENGVKLFDTTLALTAKGTARNGKALLSGSTWDETNGKYVYTNVVLYTA